MTLIDVFRSNALSDRGRPPTEPIEAELAYPGETTFYCFTRPGTRVRFLPEQCHV